ncbi:MAG: amino acid ABC transporter substrate-binding protein [Clostridioides sp.]|jgi:polar amino acid transport system substrate-binding protein|nr:amino acid ABC transporter substrate-binding protein [Clostridioides sp.]
MKGLKRLAVLVSTLLLTVTAVGCSNKSTSDTQEQKSVVVGYDNTFVPMGFLDDKGEATGFDVELAREAFKRLDKEVTFQSIDWSMKETELNSGNIDVLWNGYTITNERKEQVNFTDPYIENKQIIVVMANSDLSTKADLAGKEVGTQQGSSSVEAIEADEAFQKSLSGEKPLLYDTFDKALRDLEIGRLNAVVGDEVLIKYYISQKGSEKYKVLEEDLGEEEYGIATAKTNTELCKQINDVIKEMKDDGTFDKIYNKWFK